VGIGSVSIGGNVGSAVSEVGGVEGGNDALGDVVLLERFCGEEI
jgi:hypothetical protein